MRKIVGTPCLANDPVVVYDGEQFHGFTFTNEPGLFTDVCPQPFLDVDLLDFTAKAGENQVNLSWQTVSERNSDYFVVDRSSDMETWDEVGRLPAAGFSESLQMYFLPDQDPLIGTTYYRLREFNTNGQSTMELIRPVEFRKDDLLLYPNPTQNHIRISGDLSNIERFRVTDMRGQIVLEHRPQSESTEHIELGILPAGTYMLEYLSVNGVAHHKRFVKTN